LVKMLAILHALPFFGISMLKLSERLTEVLVAVAPVAVVYFAGIMYISFYLSSFSISIHEIELPIPVVLSYSFNTFSNRIFVASITAIIITIVVLAVIFKRVKYRWLRVTMLMEIFAIKFAMFILTAMIFFIMVYFSAADSATLNSSDVWNGQSSTVIYNKYLSKFDFDLDIRQEKLLKRCFEQRNIRFIIATNDVTYSICKVTDNEGLLITQTNQGGVFWPIRDLVR